MSLNVNQYQENIFYHYILNNINICKVTEPTFFTNKIISQIFEIAKEHAIKYREAPSLIQINDIITLKGLSETITKDMTETLYNAKESLNQYDESWLNDNATAWIQLRNLDSTIRKAIAFIKTSPTNAENASSIVENVRQIISSQTSLDFNFNLGLDFFDANSHKQTKLKRASTGYNYIDTCLKGGYWPGALIVFLSGPKAGKSQLLCNLAERSTQLGYNTAYITLELQEELVTMRMGSNMLNIPIDNYEEIAKDENFIRTKLNKIQKDSFFPLGKLHIKEFPASTAGVPDIEAYLKKTEEILGIKFKNVFVDYINIMKNWRNPNSENTYMKIKQICEDLRAMGSRNDWCTISCTQTNRQGIENSDMNVTDISESIGLLQTVDVLFGLITNPEMKSKGEYYIKCLADRVTHYENTKKRFTIDWKYCRIREDESSPIVECNTNDIAVANMSKTYKSNQTSVINSTPMPVPELHKTNTAKPKDIMNKIDPSSSLSFNNFSVEMGDMTH